MKSLHKLKDLRQFLFLVPDNFSLVGAIHGERVYN